MIQELLTIGLPLAKFILAAALMVFFYKLLYKDKTTFNHCRIFLLSIAFVSLLVSQFNIVIYTPPAKIVEIKVPQSIPVVALKSVETPTSVQPAVLEEIPTFQKKIQEFLTVKNSLLLTYILIAFVLLVSLFIQFFKIQAAKRKGNVLLQDGYEMVMSPDIAAPFSFHKSIFIGTNLTGSKLEMIVKHEQWHIKHHHYLDVLVMEMLVRIFWFNPVLWWVRKELRNVSEFQADRSVLDEGHDLYKYQTIILEEVMAHNPYLANGFNNSFTKKRFIMMKNKCQIRMTTLRRVLILPFLVGVFSLLSLSVGKSQVKYVTTTTNGNLTVTKTVEKDSENSPTSTITMDSTYESGDNKTTTTNNFTVKLNDKSYSNVELDKAMNDMSIGLGQAIVELNKLAKNPDIANRKEGINKVFKSMDVKMSNSNVGNLSFSDEFVASFTKEDFKASADNFSKIKTNIDDLKKEKSSTTKSMAFSQQMMLLMQDNLISKVLKDALSQAMGTLMGSMQNMTGAKGDIADEKNGMSGLMGNMTGLMNNMTGMLSTMVGTSNGPNASTQVDEAVVESPKFDDAPVEESPQIDAPVTEDGTKTNKNRRKINPDDEIMKNAYRLKPEQIKVIDMPYSDGVSVYTIEKNKVETKITLAFPMKYEGWWIRFAKGFRIIDQQTKDTYMIRKLDKNIPLSEILLAPGISNKMIAVTMIFPPLKESVKRINILEVEEPDEVIPSNSGGAIQFLNVNLTDYLVNGSYSPKVFK